MNDGTEITSKLESGFVDNMNKRMDRLEKVYAIREHRQTPPSAIAEEFNRKSGRVKKEKEQQKKYYRIIQTVG